MPFETSARIVSELADRGYNADREAVTLLANAADPDAALEAAIDEAPADAFKLSKSHVRDVLADPPGSTGKTASDPIEEAGSTPPETKGPTAEEKGKRAGTDAGPTGTDGVPAGTDGGPAERDGVPVEGDGGPVERDGGPVERDGVPVEGDGVPTGTDAGQTEADGGPLATVSTTSPPDSATRSTDQRSLVVAGDVTGESVGTGTYQDFVSIFRDRYDRLSGKLRSRVNHRPAEAIDDLPGGTEVAMIGMVDDVRSTKNGHSLVDLEDPTGTFPWLVLKDRELADVVDELVIDEVLAMTGTLSDDGGIAFADAIHFPDVPRTYEPNTADRHVQAALISDVHVGSEEFRADAWERFARWLHTEAAESIEYLLIAGDMVEGVGVYPDQDEELSIIDIYEQYEAFAEHLKAVPGDLDVVMIPGNHDAVRLAEPQPAFDEELRDIMSVHDARVVGNPSTVTLEGVSILLYHGVSLDELIAELPAEKASYDEPHLAMAHLLKKRHVAPQFGGRNRHAPEPQDWLVMDEIPDVFHTGHVHKLGVGTYHRVRTVNSGCWQAQTAFQRSVNIDPDVGFAPILDLDTLDVTVRKFI